MCISDFGPTVGSWGSGSGLKQRLVSVKFILAGFEPERSHGDLFRDQNSGFGIDRLAWLHWFDLFYCILEDFKGFRMYFLKESDDNARVLLLDNHSVFGGEAKQNEVEVDGYRLQAPQGSNMCLWPARVMSELGFFYHPVWEEVGLPMGDEPDAPTWLETAAGSDKDLAYAKEHYAHMMIYRDRKSVV